MRYRTAVYIILFTAIAALLLLAAAIAFGGASTPAPMLSINDPFKAVDYTTLPILRRYQGADGTDLYYREYESADGVNKGSAVLAHGSSADNKSLHALAKALAASGLRVFALDIRGHGASGEKGESSCLHGKIRWMDLRFALLSEEIQEWYQDT
jgi:predicted alpha/beta-fold hydrolase